MGVGSLERKLLGVRIESPKVDLLIVGGFLLIAPLIARLRRTEVVFEADTKLPEKESAFIFANHEDTFDSPALMWVWNKYAKRVPRMVVRDTLLDLNKKENPKVLKRIGSKNEAQTDKLWFKQVLRIRAKIVSGGGPIPISRGGGVDQLKDEVNEALASKQAVFMYGQETRRPKGGLRDFRLGPAMLASQFPDVPIYLMAVSGVRLNTTNVKSFWESLRGPIRIWVSKPCTYNELMKKDEINDPRDVTRYMRKQLMEHLPEDLR